MVRANSRELRPITERVWQADRVAITLVTRIEVLQGRFAPILKAADGGQLLRAQRWLQQNEQYMPGLEIVPFDAAAAAEFDKLRQNKKLKKIGRADLPIASIALAHGAPISRQNRPANRLSPSTLQMRERECRPDARLAGRAE